MNRHLRPYYYHCDVCREKVNSVIKIETFSEDLSLAMALSDLEWELVQLPRERPTIKVDARRKNVIFDLVKSLSQEAYEGLLDIYHVDFLLFGYSMEQYSPRKLKQ